MGDGEEGPDCHHPARVELGDCFLQETLPDGFWTFGRGSEILMTGLSTEEAFLLVMHLRKKSLR
jgi:hypothetical protein